MIKRLYFFLLSFLLVPNLALALNNDVDLGAPDEGPLAAIGAFMQSVIDFAGGPGVLFIVFIASVAAVALWVFAPKSGSAAIAWGARVLVGGILIFNVALLLTWLQGF